MKSEQRHELKENELAHMLEQAIETTRPYAKLILGGIILLVVGVIAYVIVSADPGVARSPEWNSLYVALDDTFRAGEDDVKRQAATAQLSELAEQSGDKPAGLWAAQLAGEQQLADASDKAFTDPEAGKIEIQRAIDLFQRVEKAAQHDILKQKAMWHLGIAYELQATDEALEQGRKTYQRIVEEWPDSEMSRMAERRVEWLNDPEVVGPDGFYAWYRQQDFAALAAESESRMPSGFGPGQPFPGLDDPGQNLLDPTSPPEDDKPLFEPSINLEGLSPSGNPPAADMTPGVIEESGTTPAEPASPETEAPAPTEDPAPGEEPAPEPTETPEVEPSPEPETAEPESTEPEEPAPPAEEESSDS
ncbi:MAG: hypothetical protein WDZ51_14825 [Pirellulaceae bacterium]